METQTPVTEPVQHEQAKQPYVKPVLETHNEWNIVVGQFTASFSGNP
jgi:hypothetical protein